MELLSLSGVSRQSIKQLISNDYLDFSRRYTLDSNTFTFLLENGTHVSLLANGILGINLASVDKHAKSIVLSCGIHGNETAPIEICSQLVTQILNQSLLSKHRILFIFGNIDAMNKGVRFIDENLNRLFVRTNAPVLLNTYEKVRADTIKHIVDSFFNGPQSEKIHYDLHTAIRPSKHEKFAVYPFLHGREYDLEQLAFLSACDVNTILLSQSPTGTFSYYSSFYHHAHSFTVELGKVKPFGENDMRNFSAVKKQLIALLSKEQVLLKHYNDCPITVFKVNQVINREHENFSLGFSENIANFTEFDKGDVLAIENGTPINATHNGEAIVFPNAEVAIGQRALLTVIPCEL
ncbi:succinylglutamate desuccinylase [Glaciecola petra]|uniref:Succinylglutamate desuccinylase n=1 Tax=Glaciecola petra TaxID=3075602 RepID=A0ABU2ZRS7_9ALTE|nr:succinylglutamate desuccinylase [Aestuariibacter sp. P117]MDT0594142.1 succinylglutamate desuccinylase [Aestuariibacter sp. P117]